MVSRLALFAPPQWNGIKSVSQHIGEDYARVRVGIGPKKPAQIDAADFVLQDFNTDEEALLPALQREVAGVNAPLQLTAVDQIRMLEIVSLGAVVFPPG